MQNGNDKYLHSSLPLKHESSVHRMYLATTAMPMLSCQNMLCKTAQVVITCLKDNIKAVHHHDEIILWKGPHELIAGNHFDAVRAVIPEGSLNGPAKAGK